MKLSAAPLNSLDIFKAILGPVLFISIFSAILIVSILVFMNWNLTGEVLSQTSNGNFVLYVSNQSFAINPVDINIFIDRKRAVQGEFDVDGQHNWIKYVFRLSTGMHSLQAVSQKGATFMIESFHIKRKHWAVIDYWYYPSNEGGAGPTPKHLSFRIQDEEIKFE
jgi:hypothetical protein